MKVLVTGVAGFIGFHLTQKLLDRGVEVIGIDNLNDYYDVSLKEGRLSQLAQNKHKENFEFIKMDLVDNVQIESLFNNNNFEVVINLAAQAGVRYSIENPRAYIDSNVVGFLNILEGCRNKKIKHLIYASSSSVYGANKKMPFSEIDSVDHPVSLYAATKKSNELLAHAYSHLYKIPTTGLRFFTVYGPWGRPDMAYFKFAKNITEGKPINVFNNGDMYRDFTYIDDIVEGIVRLMDVIPEPMQDSNVIDPSNSYAPYRVYNIGNNNPEKLMEFINILEKAIGKKAEIEFLPMQKGDVKATYADINKLNGAVGFKPSTSLEVGLDKFVDWYKDYYTISNM